MEVRSLAHRLHPRSAWYDPAHITCRMVVLGSPGVGKTALTVRFLTKRFIGEYCPTLESIYKSVVEVDGEEVKLEILDSAGHISDITKQGYILWADCFVFVYSITDKNSYTEACELKRRVDTIRKNSAFSVLVGNKTDLIQFRAISHDEALKGADELECSFHEVSACDWMHIATITELFLNLYRQFRKRKFQKDISSRKHNSSRFKLAIQKVISGRVSPKC